MVRRVERLVVPEMEYLELVITFRARSYFDFNVCSCAGPFFLLPNGVVTRFNKRGTAIVERVI